MHKKTQENLEHRTHRRAVKGWDAHPDVVDMLVQYLERHVASGVGMRAVKWQRAPVGVGRKTMEGVLAIGHMRLDEQVRADKVRALGEQIVRQEMAAAGATKEAAVQAKSS